MVGWSASSAPWASGAARRAGPGGKRHVRRPLRPGSTVRLYAVSPSRGARFFMADRKDLKTIFNFDNVQSRLPQAGPFRGTRCKKALRIPEYMCRRLRPAEEKYHADRHCSCHSCPCGRVSVLPFPPFRFRRRLRLRLFLLQKGRLRVLLHCAGTVPRSDIRSGKETLNMTASGAGREGVRLRTGEGRPPRQNFGEAGRRLFPFSESGLFLKKKGVFA